MNLKKTDLGKKIQDLNISCIGERYISVRVFMKTRTEKNFFSIKIKFLDYIFIFLVSAFCCRNIFFKILTIYTFTNYYIEICYSSAKLLILINKF